MREMSIQECGLVCGGEGATAVDDVEVVGKKKQNVFFGSYTSGVMYGEVGVGGGEVYVGGGAGYGKGLGVGMENAEDVSSGVNVTPTSVGIRVGVRETYEFLKDGANDMFQDFLDDTGLRQIPSLQRAQ